MIEAPTEDNDKSPVYGKVVKEQEDDKDVDLDRMGITNPDDRSTLQDLMWQDNMEVEEVVQAEEQDEDVKQNTESVDPDNMDVDKLVGMKLEQEKGNLDDTNESEIKVVKTIEDDSDIDLNPLHITDENDKSTLEDLIAQDNMEVEEVVPIESNKQEDTEQRSDSKIKIVKIVEDDSDVDMDRMHITDENDKATLEELLAQDNMVVDEVVPITEYENQNMQDNKNGEMKVIKTVDDDSDLDLERMHISDENDKSTLEDLIAQDNMNVEEVVPAKEDKGEYSNNDEPEMKIVKTIEDDSDVDINRMHITDENDKSTLEELLVQDNMGVVEVVPVKEYENNNEEKQTENDNDDNQTENNNEFVMKVVETIVDDESDVNLDRLHITDENDLSTIQQLLNQDNINVEEVIPVADERKTEEKIDNFENNDMPIAKVLREEDDDSDIDLNRMHIRDGNDKSTLEDLLNQDNMEIKEVVPVDEESIEESEMKVVKIEESDSDIDLERMHINDEIDKSTLEQLIAQDNMNVEEVFPIQEEGENREQVSNEEESEMLMAKVIRTEEDDTDVDLDTMHIPYGEDRMALEQLMSQDNMEVEEVIPLTESTEQKAEDEPEHDGQIKIIRVEEDDSDINLDNMHIGDENDKSTLDQLLSQENMNVEEVIPVDEEQARENHEPMEVVRETYSTNMPDLENLGYPSGNDRASLEQIMRQRDFNTQQIIDVGGKENNRDSLYKKLDAMRRRKMRKPVMGFFQKKVIEEEETTETTEYIRPVERTVPRCCLRPVSVGDCDGQVMQWHYDANIKTCVPFKYSGCGGNRNRFDTIGACLRKCGGETMFNLFCMGVRCRSF